ncbi:MAG TPA: hypothetical protein VF403_17605 [Kofleriaceae bacterium]
MKTVDTRMPSSVSARSDSSTGASGMVSADIRSRSSTMFETSVRRVPIGLTRSVLWDASIFTITSSCTATASGSAPDRPTT